jgi:hypothetical protein
MGLRCTGKQGDAGGCREGKRTVAAKLGALGYLPAKAADVSESLVKVSHAL